MSHLILFSVEILPSGSIGALDRIPSPMNLRAARSAAAKNGCRLMLCVGGNGRSAGFPSMVARKELRARFVKELVVLLDELGLHGVDYNWEYPGYDFRTGYASNDAVETDYHGLGLLLKETRAAFGLGDSARVLSMAYYPDGRQEQLLSRINAHTYVDFFNIMSYDQQNIGHHSSVDFGLSTLRQGAQILPVQKLCLGVPFYGRLEGSGEWKTYEDIIQKWPARKNSDIVTLKRKNQVWTFNGVTSIKAKVAAAIDQGAAGVMIWEVGQDCRRNPVLRDGQTHVATCSRDSDSLLLAISDVLASRGVQRASFISSEQDSDEL